MAQESAALPEDVLVEILRRLPPHSLAASRWVCRAWRDAVDARLRGHLLSHSVRGIFINYTKHTRSEFFSRPSTGPAICGGLDFLPYVPGRDMKVKDHCNGLVLCHDWEHDYVVNPAKQRWACLPQRPLTHLPEFDQTAYLAFDPAVSPHYEVYLIPRVPYGALNDSGWPSLQPQLVDERLLETEWPLASHVIHVFSSMTQRWDKKTFLREGEAAAEVIADVAESSNSYFDELCAVYWRGVLYIHDQCDFVMRICLSNYKYQIIRMPDRLGSYPSHHLGRSMRGVCCAISHSCHELQLWYLDESCGQMKWVLKHDVDLESFGRKFHLHRDYAQQMDKHWTLQDVNYRKCPCFLYDRKTDGNYEAQVEEKYEWNSDDDNILDTDHDVRGTYWSRNIGFLGFHPYKEMVFLALSLDESVAYDWNSSKFQYLGRILPKHYQDYAMEGAGIDTYFSYTPCWVYDFPRIISESQLEDEQLPAGKGLDSTSPGRKVRWKKPVQGVFKITVNASFHEQEMQGAMGLVVRDHVGSLISAQALWYAHAPSPMIMEAIAIRDAVKLATERGYHRVEMESEAREVVKLMKEPWIIGRSEIASIAREVKKLSDSFTSFSIAYVGRTANQAAQRCANRASAQRRRCLWINYKPQFLIDILENDSNNSG